MPSDQPAANDPSERSLSPTRRHFLKEGGMMLAGSAMIGGQIEVARAAHAAGSETIRIGLIGCGSRGTGAAIEAIASHPGEVKLVAMGDVFENNIQRSFRTINSRYRDSLEVSDRRFVGLDAYLQVMQSDVDLVILATPPAFRPLHFEAAVAAGKHVFLEKPVAADTAGVRRILAANEIAKAKSLGVQVGLQRRHESKYQQCIDRIHRGEIGECMFGRAYWNGSGVWVRPRQPQQTELEYQLRNWYYFTWLSGDHINEQHVHNLDVINWALGSHPIEAQGQGGRQTRDGSEHGQIFDHHMVEYTYASGFKLFSQCRQMRGCWNSVGETIQGTNGIADIHQGLIRDREGRVRWQYEGQSASANGWQQEQIDFIAALKAGLRPSEVEYGVASTMTAIMGRMATYTGKRIKWEDALTANESLANIDALTSLDDPAPVQPDADGKYPIAKPGLS